MKRVIVTGSVAYDYIMGFPGEFSDHILADKLDVLSVSFLVDSLRREPGGCAPNIAYTLALLGQRVAVMATVGHDYSERTRLEENGVDMSLVQVFQDEFTSSFFVSTDRSNRQIASFFVGAMGRADELSLHDIDTSNACVIIAPNAPSAMASLVGECATLGVPYVYDPSQQIVRLSKEDLIAGIDGCRVLVANDYESALIKSKTGLGIDDLRARVETLVITHGENGSKIYDNGVVYEIPTVRPNSLVDPTGVGDAYRAGILMGLTQGVPWPQAGRAGALCATFALESIGTQRHVFTPAELLSRYAANFGEPPPELETALFEDPALLC